MAGRGNPTRRSPWKRGSPWRKASRPKRWSASSAGVDEPQGIFGSVLPNEIGLFPNGSPPLDTIISGEFDVEDWADEQEITVDRVIGDIALSGAVTFAGGASYPCPLYIRLGLIVSEDLSDDPAASDPTRGLFDQTDLQEAEWMWLTQIVPTPVYSQSAGVWLYNENIHVDLRNRRKIGQKDVLFLYGAYAIDTADNGRVTVFNIREVHNLRCIMMSK